MFVKTLKLRDFRSYEDLDISFCDGLNMLRGDNAMGKTNALESVFLCSAGRSHRTSRDSEMVRYGARTALAVVGLWRRGVGDIEISVEIERTNGKCIRVNGTPLRRLGELMGRLPVVMFSPEDLGIIKDEPQARRRFLDIFICQVKPAYFFDLHQYNKALKQRNALLRRIRESRGGARGWGGGISDMSGDMPSQAATDELSAWDAALASYGARVMDERARFCERLNERAGLKHSVITDRAENLRVSYAPSIKFRLGESKQDVESKILAVLEKNAASDVARATTQCGPHKDDMSTELDGVSLRQYGSQGQQRTASLALKMAQVDVMAEIIGETPVLLLDDVMSELDASRQINLASHIMKTQTIVTGVDSRFMESYVKTNTSEDVVNASIFDVKYGSIEKYEEKCS